MDNEVKDSFEQLYKSLFSVLKCIYKLIYIFISKCMKMLFSLFTGIFHGATRIPGNTVIAYNYVRTHPYVLTIFVTFLFVVEFAYDSITRRALETSCNFYKYNDSIHCDSIKYYKDFVMKHAFDSPKVKIVYKYKYVPSRHSTRQTVGNDSIQK